MISLSLGPPVEEFGSPLGKHFLEIARGVCNKSAACSVRDTYRILLKYRICRREGDSVGVVMASWHILSKIPMLPTYCPKREDVDFTSCFGVICVRVRLHPVGVSEPLPRLIS